MARRVSMYLRKNLLFCIALHVKRLRNPAAICIIRTIWHQSHPIHLLTRSAFRSDVTRLALQGLSHEVNLFLSLGLPEGGLPTGYPFSSHSKRSTMSAMSCAALPWNIECHLSFLSCSRSSTYLASNNGHKIMKELIIVPLSHLVLTRLGWNTPCLLKFWPACDRIYFSKLCWVLCCCTTYDQLSARAWLVVANACLKAIYLGSHSSLRKVFEPYRGPW